jgi:hypothetical protein
MQGGFYTRPTACETPATRGRRDSGGGSGRAYRPAGDPFRSFSLARHPQGGTG